MQPWNRRDFFLASAAALAGPASALAATSCPALRRGAWCSFRSI